MLKKVLHTYERWMKCKKSTFVTAESAFYLDYRLTTTATASKALSLQSEDIFQRG